MATGRTPGPIGVKRPGVGGEQTPSSGSGFFTDARPLTPLAGGPREIARLLKSPPRVDQGSEPVCWAAALASWLMVKGIVPGESPKQGEQLRDYIVNSFNGTECIHPSGGLHYETDNEVFAEFGVLYGEGHKTFDYANSGRLDRHLVLRLVKNHGHFMIALGVKPGNVSHFVVVYGIVIHDPRTLFDYSFKVMDPLGGGLTEIHNNDLEYPLVISVGAPALKKPAPCRKRKRPRRRGGH